MEKKVERHSAQELISIIGEQSDDKCEAFSALHIEPQHCIKAKGRGECESERIASPLSGSDDYVE